MKFAVFFPLLQICNNRRATTPGRDFTSSVYIGDPEIGSDRLSAVIDAKIQIKADTSQSRGKLDESPVRDMQPTVFANLQTPPEHGRF